MFYFNTALPLDGGILKKKIRSDPADLVGQKKQEDPNFMVVTDANKDTYLVDNGVLPKPTGVPGM